jgi:hypothetical protein
MNVKLFVLLVSVNSIISNYALAQQSPMWGDVKKGT